MIENLSHIPLNIKLPITCKNELLEIKDYYGLPIKKYYHTSLGHAFRSYVFSQKAAYNINNIETFIRTNSWNKIPKTIKWITENLCDEKDLGMVCLHKLTANGWVDWHRHNHNFKVVHFSLITNDNDLSEVKVNDKIYSVNYPELEGYIFNSHEQHRSTNFSDRDRIHLVVECLPNNGKFKTLYNKRN